MKANVGGVDLVLGVAARALYFEATSEPDGIPVKGSYHPTDEQRIYVASSVARTSLACFLPSSLLFLTTLYCRYFAQFRHPVHPPPSNGPLRTRRPALPPLRPTPLQTLLRPRLTRPRRLDLRYIRPPHGPALDGHERGYEECVAGVYVYA